MSTTRVIHAFSPDVSYRSVTLVFGVTVVVALAEWFLFVGDVTATLWTYSLLLVGLSLAPVFSKRDLVVCQAFVLIPVFRLVNLTMPVFVELTVFWLPLIYGPFVPVILYIGLSRSNEQSGDAVERPSAHAVGIGAELPWWLGGDRRSKLRGPLHSAWQFLAVPADASLARTILHRSAQVLFVVSLPLLAILSLLTLGVLVLQLAEIEHGILTPTPLVPSLDPFALGVLAVTMICFVGFVEELLFRGVLQKVLERRLGLVPGLLVASAIFALMHSGYGVGAEIAFAGGIGLLFGIIYDATDSLALVSVMHGLLNVLVFGIIPLDGGSAIDLVRSLVPWELPRFGVSWGVEFVLEFAMLGGVL